MDTHQILNKLYKKSNRYSCMNCYNLRICRGVIWCKVGLVEKCDILDLDTKMSKKITKQNRCVYNDMAK